MIATLGLVVLCVGALAAFTGVVLQKWPVAAAGFAAMLVGYLLT